MNSSICTLFEDHYHYGLAALANSLYTNGYRGDIFAGYKGSLPPWAKEASNNASLNWKDATTFIAAEGLRIHFLPLDTDYHLTNYKPDFMLKLWEGPAAQSLNMFYFDPDIVVVRSWALFEEWASCGIAVSEDVNSPLEENHPRRVAWRRYFGNHGIVLQFKNAIYVNGGFIGVNKADIAFLELWKKMQETMAPVIGGLNLSIFKNKHLDLLEQAGGPFMPFVKTDQDALNAAIEVTSNKISYIGKEGMGFDNGFILMYHALGIPKPWKWKLITQAIDGRPPRPVDIAYWKVSDGPVMAEKSGLVKRRMLYLKFFTAVGRFYRRN